MPTLPSELRSKLEKVVVEARDVAEAGVRVALEALAVHHHEPYAHLSETDRKLRNHLRARARQLGDEQDAKGRLQIDHIIRECAYEHWHRMLFARFLAENGLLIEPEMEIAISLQEAEELVRDTNEDVWTFAGRCVQVMLPQIFRPDDPLLRVSLATEHMLKIEELLNSLEAQVFTASDALGWVYQFWQSKRKDEVNASGVKIGADELPAVTQLFTEHYMVLFLYHNTIGAWHTGRVLAENPSLAETAQSEEELRQAVRLRSQGGYYFEYLRFVREPREGDEENTPTGPWRPAAGTFQGWPKTAKELKVLDPCCGSGHFLTEGFELLVRLRMDEEGLDLEDAIRAVLADNLHGLELDPRCTQIAAFNLAMAAWKLASKPIELPPLHIACSGLAVGSTKNEWTALAGDDGRLRAGMERLYDLFEQAPELGSLIDPKALAGNLIEADFAELQPLLEQALKRERESDEQAERAVAAQGMARAAELLSGEYTLAITNVPYLPRGSHSEPLKDFADEHHEDARKDLATIFLDRCLELVSIGGAVGTVALQYWLFLTGYTGFRRTLLGSKTWQVIALLGSGAFETISGEVVNVSLQILAAQYPPEEHYLAGIDVESKLSPVEKSIALREEGLVQVPQGTQAANPDSRVIIAKRSSGALLSKLADGIHGLGTKDSPAFIRCFWEVQENGRTWEFMQSSVQRVVPWGGLEHIVFWEAGEGVLHDRASRGEAILAGSMAHDSPGILVSQVGSLPCTLYTGGLFEKSAAVIRPIDDEHVAAIWAYASSKEYSVEVRKIDRKVAVTNRTLVKVPFDLAHWQKVAAGKYPNGLPEPYSDDPTQWLFHGHPAKAEPHTVLQVVVGRLLGYRWPPELDPEMHLADEAREWVARCDELLEYADEDGIVCIPSIRGEQSAAERLRALLAVAYGDEWTHTMERDLIAATGSNETDLDSWLRNDFFEQHCKLFHHRPFVWHIWDGRKRDGFHTLVNYHKLAEGDGGGRRTLENLTYSYLGDWITRQKDGVRRGEAGAEDRLAAALELQQRLIAILEGEPPFDIFVRWKPLREQAIGWDPDINDGVRLNIRPFLASDLLNGKKGAGVLRWKANIKWGKDRGKEPLSLRPKADYPWFWSWNEQAEDFLGGDEFDGNRWNNLHYSNKMKRSARDKKSEKQGENA